MAYGFGSTLGAGSTDKVTSAYSSEHTQTTYFFSVYRNGAGGGGNGRVFDKNSTHLLTISSGSNLAFARGTSGLWTFDIGANATWHHVAVSMDTGSTLNDPVAYSDGASLTVTESGAPLSFATDANSYVWGNRSDDTRNWDGILARCGIYSATLTADEMVALTKGFSPTLIRPQSLVEYLPLVRDAGSLKNAAPTVVGCAIQPHPRLIGAY